MWSVRCSAQKANSFTFTNMDKNIFGSYYHIREPKTRQLQMTFREYAQCAKHWTTSKILFKVHSFIAPYHSPAQYGIQHFSDCASNIYCIAWMPIHTHTYALPGPHIAYSSAGPCAEQDHAMPGATRGHPWACPPALSAPCLVPTAAEWHQMGLAAGKQLKTLTSCSHIGRRASCLSALPLAQLLLWAAVSRCACMPLYCWQLPYADP